MLNWFKNLFKSKKKPNIISLRFKLTNTNKIIIIDCIDLRKK
jgi:hypothetical protein